MPAPTSKCNRDSHPRKVPSTAVITYKPPNKILITTYFISYYYSFQIFIYYYSVVLMVISLRGGALAIIGRFV